MSTNPLVTLNSLGQSIWIDTISRNMLRDGTIESLINSDAVNGLTSNPAIFEKAIGSGEYNDALRQAREENPSASLQALFETLAIDDIRQACDLFRPLFDASAGGDGRVSLEVSPTLAHDAQGTVREALDLHRRIERENVMIKVPGTTAGVEAFRALTQAGISVNVTLLFSVSRYRKIAAAYLSGLAARHAAGHSLRGLSSVASFFISRVDSAVDPQLDQLDDPRARALRGQIAIANAKVAYGHFQNLYQSAQWAELEAAGALPQRLLWASTGTKDPSYSDVYYVDALLGPNTVNTLPPATLEAYRAGGEPADRLGENLAQSSTQLAQAAALGINLDALTERLEEEGIAQFSDAFARLLTGIEQHCKSLT